MDIILKQDVKGLGYIQDIVSVKPGYARNYLIPRGYAIVATPSAVKVRNEVVKQQEHKRAKLIKDANDLATALSTVKVTLKVKATDTGTIFGSVTAAMIADAIKAQFNYDVDKKQIVLADDRIKELGEYKANVNVFKDVKTAIDIVVEKEAE
ncbi:MAG: 50S ribosomal protein L9 [Bacteroidales bacterium]|jgi:large subunit ribosomal protein L9|nr:50S ribosomal protein L9 [Bacteroidales bacterium]MDD2204971.1 50S ribosomal protein L9 [Bacteroidales bacterium]MDD3151813.1 50S ribosomal protein L9 [Bacteroidales bacterium]MDD3913913.1 50S ribosomal protein L9 [Bacteroidales bacterium]MDD4634248.1 50S ribosomal protein L9 [Bacteroidales bacterium]